MLTAELISSVAPRARADYADALVNGIAVLEAAGINTPMRLAQFLANISHETGGFTIVRESGRYSAKRLIEVWPKHFTASTAKKYANNPEKLFNFIYGPDTPIGKVLGNTRAGDGFSFRGGGYLQTTGRYNYTKIGKEIGVDLGDYPELIEQPDISLKAAANEFAKFVEFCDRGDAGFRAVCNGINRGNATSKLDPIGWLDRQLWLKKWTDALDAPAPAADDTLELGDHGALVKAFQERLAALGYANGSADGIFGSRTRVAVLAFQAENKIGIDGKIGPQTRAALNSENAVPMPLGDRKDATVDDLRKAGSGTVKIGDGLTNTAVGLFLGGSAGGVGQQLAPTPPAPAIDLVLQTKTVVTEISSWKAIVASIGEVFLWATSHVWILMIVAAFLLFRYGSDLKITRLIAHRLGVNLVGQI